MNQVFFVLILSAAVSGLMIQPLESVNKGDNLIQNILESVDPRKKKEILEAVESSLLGMFKLGKRPRPKKDIKVPEYLKDLYKKYTENPNGMGPTFDLPHRTSGIANTIRSFYHDDDKERVVEGDQCRHGNCVRYWFNVSNIPSEEDLTAAEFRIFIDSDNSVADNDGQGQKVRHFRVEMHEVIKPEKNDREAITRLIDVKNIFSKTNATWTSFDANPAVIKWKKSPELNHGVEIRISPSKVPIKHVRLRRSATLAEDEWHAQRPILVTYTDDKSQIRTKRAADQNSNSSKRKKRKRKNRRRRKNKNNRRRKFKKACRRKPLYVDFSAVGWTDWIYAPPGYQAYYCQGECHFPYPEHMNATNHAIVQDLVNSINKSVPKPCCVPTDLSPVPLLYLDEYNQVILKSYQNMRVEGCGCR